MRNHSNITSDPWFSAAWDAYYQRNTHTKMWPAEELVRILSRLKKTSGHSNACVTVLGCGNGRHCWLAANLGYRSVVGIDISEVGLTLASKWLSQELIKVDFIQNRESQCSINSDILVCHGVLDHMLAEQGEELFNNAVRGIAEHGICVQACKSEKHTENGKGIPIGERLFLASEDHQEAGIPQRFFTEKELTALVSRTGCLEISEIHTIGQRILPQDFYYERIVIVAKKKG